MKIGERIRELCLLMKKVSRYNPPYWDDDLKALQEERNALRSQPGMVEEWKEKNGELSRLLMEKKKEYWRNHVEEIGGSADPKKLWKTIKLLTTGDKGEAENEVMLVDGRELRTDGQKAESFGRLYADASKLKLGKMERAKRVEVGRRLRDYAREEEESGRPFNIELESALQQMDSNKKGGDDGIEAAFMKNLPESWRVRWLDVFNDCWREGFCPGIWKKALVIPILKQGKDPKSRSSYRPVSLTSICVKTMERMTLGRLYYWMERESTVNTWQAGFQRGRSTEELVAQMVQEIQDGWEERPHRRTLVVTLDCSKAFDRVWTVRLLERLMEEGVPGPLVRWYSSFLEGRKISVRVGGTRGKWRNLPQGVPQGAVSSPALFLLYTNAWEGLQEEDVRYGGFADDLALWSSAQDLDTLRGRMQRALDKVGTWAEGNKISLNPGKSECCLFTRYNPERSWDAGLSIGGSNIGMRPLIKYLGVNIDQGLTFREHVGEVAKRVKKRAGSSGL